MGLPVRGARPRIGWYVFAGTAVVSSALACSRDTVGADGDDGTGTGGADDDDNEDTLDGDSVDETAGPIDDDFAVAHVAGLSFAAKRIQLVGTTCEGPACPSSVVAVDGEGQPLTPCAESEDAIESPLGVDEYCRFAPISAAFGFELGFTTPVDPESFEPTRATFDDAGATEPYRWWADAVTIRGPATVYRGEWIAGSNGAGDRVATLHNLTCIDRLEMQGVEWTPSTLDALCSAVWDDDGTLRPLRMEPERELRPSAGRLDPLAGSCETNAEGPDTCCSACDLLLSTAIAKYGATADGSVRDPNAGTALSCDPNEDVLAQCRELRLSVDRSLETNTYTYAWDGEPETFAVPLYDRLRETHPDDRPAGLESTGAVCESASECGPGQACIGTDAAGDACMQGDACVDRRCRSEWFATCQTIAGGDGTAYCTDARFVGAGACFVADADFSGGEAGDRLAECDANSDGVMSATECCDAALGGNASCDPFLQPGAVPVARYDRHAELPSASQCVCEEGGDASEECAEVIDAWCAAPIGTPAEPAPNAAGGQWAVPAVGAKGGVRWNDDDAVLELRPAQMGHLGRAGVEACAESKGVIGQRDPSDTWMAHAAFIPEAHRDHDIVLCSGSQYRIELAESDAQHHLRSQGNGTLDGKSVHVFETAQFRVVPGSLFPTENLRITACETMTLGFSARYDLSPGNLRKLELHEVDGARVAGGPDCDPLATAQDIAAGAIPCLTFDVADFWSGKVGVSIDPAVHGPVLQVGATYRVVVPGLASIESMGDPDAYAASFHDACGMPLIVGDTEDVLALSDATFTIDDPCD
jgi:hypothetical protein